MADERFFKKFGPFTLEELAALTKSELIGDPTVIIKDVNIINEAADGEITFLANLKYKHHLADTEASAIILNKEMVVLAPKNCNLLLTENPYYAYALVASKFYPQRSVNPGVSSSAHIATTASIGDNCEIQHGAVIEDGAQIGNNVYIGANVFIGKGVIIGDNCYIATNTTLEYCILGQRCLIHTGVRIGQDGFGFAESEMGLAKVPQIGLVVIGNEVEIGANTCIDRGAIGDTSIGDYTKIDNLVQIAHNVQVGKYCFFAGQVGVSGSTRFGDGIAVGGQAGFAGHIAVGSKARIAAQSGVISDVVTGEVLGGTPALPIKQWFRMTAKLKQLIGKNGD